MTAAARAALRARLIPRWADEATHLSQCDACRAVTALLADNERLEAFLSLIAEATDDGHEPAIQASAAWYLATAALRGEPVAGDAAGALPPDD